LTLVDTNIFIDILSDDPRWAKWSLDSMANVAETGPLIIDSIVYSELSIRFADDRQLDGFIRRFEVELAPTPKVALVRAGKAFAAYRAAGGSRTSLLPDFFIGAHAEVTGHAILRRDIRRFRTYFPAVRLITP